MTLSRHVQKTIVTRPLQQDCGELMITRAARYCLGIELNFDYSKLLPKDVQLDVSDALLLDDKCISAHLYAGDDRLKLEHEMRNYFTAHDRCYLMRMGTNGRAGHYSLVCFDKDKRQWINYTASNEEHNKYLADENGCLTSDGVDLLVSPREKWGKADGQRCILLATLTPTVIIKIANYIYDLRTTLPEKALENLYKVNEIYPQLLAIEPVKNIVQLATTPHNTARDVLLNVLENYEILRFQREGDSQYRSRDIFHWGYSIEEKRNACSALRNFLEGKCALDETCINILRDGRLGDAIRAEARNLANDLNRPAIKTVHGFLQYLSDNSKEQPIISIL